MQHSQLRFDTSCRLEVYKNVTLVTASVKWEISSELTDQAPSYLASIRRHWRYWLAASASVCASTQFQEPYRLAMSVHKATTFKLREQAVMFRDDGTVAFGDSATRVERLLEFRCSKAAL